MVKNKKQLQQDCYTDFINRIQVKFIGWASKKGKIPTRDNFIKFLIRHNFIDTKIINRFLSIEYYHEELPKTANARYPKGRKQIAVWDAEERLPIAERQIKANLCNHSTYFRDNPFIFP